MCAVVIYQGAPQASRSPIDAWPDSFIFFDRVLGLLRGLTAALDVSHSYLDVMTPYARAALRAHRLGPAAPAPPRPRVEGTDALGGGVREAVQALLDSGEALGCQARPRPPRYWAARFGGSARSALWSAS